MAPNILPAFLKKRCRAGYRAQRIHSLAAKVVSGELNLELLERKIEENKEQNAMWVYAQLLAIEGVGPYSAANMMQLLGDFSFLPVDTEVIRHFRLHHLQKYTRKAKVKKEEVEEKDEEEDKEASQSQLKRENHQKIQRARAIHEAGRRPEGLRYSSPLSLFLTF